MKIPKKIKICGITYDVNIVEHIDDGNTCARLVRDCNLILIASGLSKEQQELSFLHECVHAVNGEMSENTVDFIAVILHGIITDNYERRTK